MVERGRRACLAPKRFNLLRIVAGSILAQDLERHLALEARLHRQIDVRVPTSPDKPPNLISAEGRSDQRILGSRLV